MMSEWVDRVWIRSVKMVFRCIDVSMAPDEREVSDWVSRSDSYIYIPETTSALLRTILYPGVLVWGR